MPVSRTLATYRKEHHVDDDRLPFNQRNWEVQAEALIAHEARGTARRAQLLQAVVDAAKDEVNMSACAKALGLARSSFYEQVEARRQATS